MFFLRNIQRRLVTGFSLALLLVIVLAGVGAVGLLWHQKAINELGYVMKHSPDRNGLSRSFIAIDDIAYKTDALQQPGAAGHPRFTGEVRKSWDKLQQFRLTITDLKKTPTLIDNQRHVLEHIRQMEIQFARLDGYYRDFRLSSDPAAARDTFRPQVREVVLELTRKVNTLPAYEEQRLAASLERESRDSRRLLIALACIAAGTMISIIIMSYCGFQWVSNPLREISSGASRIAEGDPDFRIPPVSRWQDEFSQLRTNVNLMADRFQDAERDLNRKVRERSQQLVRSERLAGLGFLAAGVAHEINNPLSIIRVAADTLDYRLHDSLPEDDPDRDEVFQRLKMIRNESSRCGEITARILDFSRNEQASARIDNITSIVQSVLAMVRPMPTYRDREIIFERTKPLQLVMNGAQIKQVLLNLIFNALQATKGGGWVEIRLIEQCDWVVVEIEDDGCGMSAETMEHLFEPFYSTKPTGQGTGLGMCITHRIIEDHHGTIEPLSPGDGQGSMFRVRLPLRQTKREVA